MTNLAQAIWGIPVVSSTAERAVLYPSPEQNQRVQNLETKRVERWNGVEWIVDSTTILNVKTFGAVGDGVTDDTQAILDAIAAAKGLSTTISGAPGPSFVATTLLFPVGQYLVQPSSIALDDLINIRLVGDGSRLWNFYAPPPSAIIIDGDGTDDTDYGIDISGQVLNMTRNVLIENLSIMYRGDFAGDLVKGDAAGFHATHVWFGAETTDETRPTTCANLIRFWNGHHYRFSECNFSDADVLVRIDNVTGSNTNGWHFTGCTFYDCATAHVYCDGAPVWGLNFTGCDFDTFVSPTYGLYLNALGCAITGCAFYGGSALTAPTSGWIYQIGGAVNVAGSVFVTQVGAAIRGTGGSIVIDGNHFFTTKSVLAESNYCVYGRGNENYYMGTANTERAWDFSQSGAAQVDVGPNNFYANTGDATKKYGYSYYVTNPVSGTADWAALAGTIRYNELFDSAVNRIKPGCLINVEQVRKQTINYTTNGGTRVVTAAETGGTFTNKGNGGNCTFTLPTCFVGAEYTFRQYEGQVFTRQITLGLTDSQIDDLGSLSRTHAVHSATSEIFAELKLEGHYNPSIGATWQITRRTGTWVLS